MFVRYFGLGVLFCGLHTVSAETIQLKEKGIVAGKILAEKRDQVVVDLGYTVLVVPRNQIVKISREDAAPQKAKAPSTAPSLSEVRLDSAELYQIARVPLAEK